MPQRKRHRRGRRRVHWLDELGHVTLTRLWSICAGAIRMVVGSLCRSAEWAWSWFRSQLPWVQVAVVCFGLALGYFGWSALGKLDRSDLYVSEEEALARVIRSEIGIGSRHEQVHVAWATRNLARKRNQSIVEMACSPCGPQERGRPVSSIQRATDSDRRLARAILEAPLFLDPTGGATQFINPRLQDQLAKRGAPGYRGRSYSVVSRRWRSRYGWERYYRLSPILELWGEKRKTK